MIESTNFPANAIFRQEFINFYFSLKKKNFFKRRKIFLKRLNFKKVKNLSKSLLKKKENNKNLLKIIKKI